MTKAFGYTDVRKKRLILVFCTSFLQCETMESLTAAIYIIQQLATLKYSQIGRHES